MSKDQNTAWNEDREFSEAVRSDSGAMRIALLFGSAAVAFALILTPLIDRGAGTVVAARGISAELDKTATGSIRRSGEYTIRRSVLQSSPVSVCIISADGRQSGEC